jgi:hypothetical protein
MMTMPKIKFERRDKVMVDVTPVADRTKRVAKVDAEGKPIVGEFDEVVMPLAAPVACKSINSAKRLSRELQAKYWPLCVRAVRS